MRKNSRNNDVRCCDVCACTCFCFFSARKYGKEGERLGKNERPRNYDQLITRSRQKKDHTNWETGSKMSNVSKEAQQE